MDRLNELFEKQIALQIRLGNMQDDWTIKNQQEFINVQTLALIDEVMEALRETPWKPWKKKQELNEENYKEELIDAWHFLINLSIASGMDAEELHERFLKKNKVNNKRQEEGY